MRACVRACVRACMHVWVWVWVWVGGCMRAAWVRACVCVSVELFSLLHTECMYIAYRSNFLINMPINVHKAHSSPESVHLSLCVHLSYFTVHVPVLCGCSVDITQTFFSRSSNACTSRRLPCRCSCPWCRHYSRCGLSGWVHMNVAGCWCG